MLNLSKPKAASPCSRPAIAALIPLKAVSAAPSASVLFSSAPINPITILLLYAPIDLPILRTVGIYISTGEASNTTDGKSTGLSHTYFKSTTFSAFSGNTASAYTLPAVEKSLPSPNDF